MPTYILSLPSPGARLVVAALSLSALASAAYAGNFSVSPVRIYMEPRDRAVAVTITNEGDADVALQTELFSWGQKPDGTDDLQPTEDLIVSPPIMKLAPGAHQVVRLARLTPPDAARQLTYRLIVREVPEVTAPKAEKDITVQLPIALAMSLPVFITPPPAKRDVQCAITRMDTQNFSALCQNTGTAYAQVRTIALSRNGAEFARFDGGTYILPGARRAMTLKTDKPVPAGPALARVQFDDGKTTDMNVELP
ncbi:MAG TPA: fimbria/pilus periplasmic chaperone [Ramlibacter sp.]